MTVFWNSTGVAWPDYTHPSSLSREEIQSALEACGGNRSKAAQYLGISRRTFYRKLEKLGLHSS